MHLDRRRFVTLLGIIALMPIPVTGFATAREVSVDTLLIDKPAGGVPNNTLPVLIYHRVLPPNTADNAEYFEHLFRSNGWPPQWRYPVYTFTHFHSNTPEVLGVYAGTAKLQLGGETGKIIEVKVGDVLLLPAGIGHKQISADEDFMLVGAYPPQVKADICHDEVAQLAARTQAVKAVPLPATDPVTGHSGGSMQIWHKK